MSADIGRGEEVKPQQQQQQRQRLVHLSSSVNRTAAVATVDVGEG